MLSQYEYKNIRNQYFKDEFFKDRFDKLLYTANLLKSTEAILTFLKALMGPTQSDYLLAIAERDQSLIPTITPDVLFFQGLLNHLYTFDEKKFKLNIENHEVNLAQDIVLPWPWNENRYVDAINYIGTNVGKPWVYDRLNHRVTMWLPWKLVFVDNGIHSLTSGILKREGKLPLTDLIDGSILFDSVQTDGIFWYINEEKKVKVNNYRHAAFFEIGRLLLNKQ